MISDSSNAWKFCVSTQNSACHGRSCCELQTACLGMHRERHASLCLKLAAEQLTAKCVSACQAGIGSCSAANYGSGRLRSHRNSFVMCCVSARLLQHTAVVSWRESLVLHAMLEAQFAELPVVLSSIHPKSTNCAKGEAMLLIAGPIISRIQAIQAESFARNGNLTVLIAARTLCPRPIVHTSRALL